MRGAALFPRVLSVIMGDIGLFIGFVWLCGILGGSSSEDLCWNGFWRMKGLKSEVSLFVVFS